MKNKYINCHVTLFFTLLVLMFLPVIQVISALQPVFLSECLLVREGTLKLPVCFLHSDIWDFIVYLSTSWCFTCFYVFVCVNSSLSMFLFSILCVFIVYFMYDFIIIIINSFWPVTCSESLRWRKFVCCSNAGADHHSVCTVWSYSQVSVTPI